MEVDRSIDRSIIGTFLLLRTLGGIPACEVSPESKTQMPTIHTGGFYDEIAAFRAGECSASTMRSNFQAKVCGAPLEEKVSLTKAGRTVDSWQSNTKHVPATRVLPQIKPECGAK